MVYTGQPSGACSQCRRRKLRCDLHKDACKQCVRAGLACSGYRDPRQLRIRDETLRTKQKALSRTKDISIAIDEKARNAFFSHYVLGFSKTYDVIEALYVQPNPEKHLSASIDAVGLAFLSFQHHSPETLKIARGRYCQALSTLSDALDSHGTTHSNSTLASVLLLDLFEKITSTVTPAAGVSIIHINGALRLIMLRNNEAFHNNITLRLAIRLSINMTISCLLAKAPIMGPLVQLRSDLEPFINKDDWKWRVSGLIIKYCNIQTVIRGGNASNFEIVEALKHLDLEFQSLANNASASWQYSTIYVSEPSALVFGDHLDIYPSHYVTQVWNVLRVLRILIQDLIASHKNLFTTKAILNADKDVPELTNTIDEIAKDICASVPQYTGYNHEKIGRRNNPAIQQLRCYTLLSPLYIAGKYSSPSTNIKSWAVSQMRYLADKLNMSKAALVADTLEHKSETNPWIVYTMLGSYALAA